MHRPLAALYRLSAGLAAVCLALIAGLVALQVLARLLDWGLVFLGEPAAGFIVPSLAEISGFLLAGATFLALADTLAHNVHIRVSLLTERLMMPASGILEGVVAVLGAGISGFSAYALAAYAFKSFSYGDVSYGIIAVPLGLPQAAMALGLVVLTVALIEEAVLGFAGRRRAMPQESAI